MRDISDLYCGDPVNWFPTGNVHITPGGIKPSFTRVCVLCDSFTTAHLLLPCVHTCIDICCHSGEHWRDHVMTIYRASLNMISRDTRATTTLHPQLLVRLFVIFFFIFILFHYTQWACITCDNRLIVQQSVQSFINETLNSHSSFAQVLKIALFYFGKLFTVFN